VNPERLAALLDPERLAQIETRRVVTLANAARDAARDRIAIRLSRLEKALVTIPDEDSLAVAMLPAFRASPDEPPLDPESAALDAALAAAWTRRLPHRPMFTETTSLFAVRRALFDRARNRLTHPYVAILGATGGGKTVAAAHAVASLDGAVYLRARRLCDLYGSYHRDDRAALERLYAAPVAVVDEVSIELGERKLGAALDEAFDARQGARRITLVIGNVKVGQLGRMLGGQTHSRMKDRVDWVQTAESDMRVARGTTR